MPAGREHYKTCNSFLVPVQSFEVCAAYERAERIGRAMGWRGDGVPNSDGAVLRPREKEIAVQD